MAGGQDRKSVYVETTVVSYLTSRPSRDLVKAAHQQVTREWWDVRRRGYRLFVSELVLEEAGRGDPEAAAGRMKALEGIPLLVASQDAVGLAGRLVGAGVFPVDAGADALHVAMAADNGIEILLTWNCRHLANGDVMYALAKELWTAGYTPPAICTPDELMGDEDA